MKNSPTLLATIAALALSFVAGCGGGSSSASNSSGGSHDSGGTSGGTGTSSGPTFSQVALVDSVGEPVIQDVQVWYEQAESASTLALSASASPVFSCDAASLEAGRPCLQTDGKLHVVCNGVAQKFSVAYGAEELKKFEVTCDKAQSEEMIPNRPFLMIYSLEKNKNELVQHQLDTETLELSVIRRLPSGQSPQKLLHLAGGNMIYTLNQGDNTIGLYHVSGITGDVDKTHTPVQTGSYPLDFVLHPNQHCLYANTVGGTDQGIWTYAVGNDGLLTKLPTLSYGAGMPPVAMTLSKDGQHAYVATGFGYTIHHYTVSPTSCAWTEQSILVTDSNVASMIVNPTATKLYTSDYVQNQFRSYDLSATGDLLKQSEEISGGFPANGEADPSQYGRVLLIGNQDGKDILNPVDGGFGMAGFQLDVNGSYAYSIFSESAVPTEGGQHVEVFVVSNDCTLEPLFSTTQGGDTLGIIVDMVPLAPSTCTQMLFIPDATTRSQEFQWSGGLE